MDGDGPVERNRKVGKLFVDRLGPTFFVASVEALGR
jgi:hypothetical protein